LPGKTNSKIFPVKSGLTIGDLLPRKNINSVKDVKHLIQKAFIKWDFQLTIGLRNSLFILYFESNFETLKIIG